MFNHHSILTVIVDAGEWRSACAVSAVADEKRMKNK